MLTVENLRKMGFRVKVRHNRERMVYSDTYVEVSPYGGFTEVEIYDFSTQQIYGGAAYCSKKDHYCRKLGVRIALGRALKAMGINAKKSNMLQYQIKGLEHNEN